MIFLDPDKLTQKILELALSHKNEPDIFIESLELFLEKSNVQKSVEKRDFFVNVGEILFDNSYFQLAVIDWKYILENYSCNDKSTMVTCYSNIGMVYLNAGHYLVAIENYTAATRILNEMGKNLEVSYCYNNLGIAYLNSGDPSKSIEHHGKALDIAKSENDFSLIFKYSLNLGLAYHSIGDYPKSIDCYVDSLDATHDEYAKSMCLTNLGRAYLFLTNFSKSIEHYNKALTIKNQLGTINGVLDCYDGLSTVYYSQKDFHKAIEFSTKILEITNLPDKKYESFAKIGDAYNNLKNFSQAIDNYISALEVSKNILNTKSDDFSQKPSVAYLSTTDFYPILLDYIDKNYGDLLTISENYKNNPDEFCDLLDNSINQLNIPVFNRSEVLLKIGNLLNRYNFDNLILPVFFDALFSCIQSKNMIAESECLRSFGLICSKFNNFSRFIEFITLTLGIAKENGHKEFELDCLMDLGITCHTVGNFSKSIECYCEILDKIEKNDKYIEARCYDRLGISYRTISEFTKSIECHTKASEIAVDNGFVELQATSLGNLGTAYFQLGNIPKSIECHTGALDLVNDEKYRSLQGSILGNLASAYHFNNESDKAIEYRKKSLDIARESHNVLSEAKSCGDLGIYYYSLNDYPNAKIYHEKAIELANSTGDYETLARLHSSLGMVFHKCDNFDSAKQHVLRALDIAIKIDHVSLQSSVYRYLSWIYADIDIKISYDHLVHSINLTEIMGKKLIEEQQKLSYYGIQNTAYDEVISLCILQNDPKKAFEYVEKSKSRSFLDLLSKSSIKPSVKLETEFKALCDEEELLLSQIRKIQRGSRTKNNINQIGTAEQISEKLQNLYNSMEEYDPEYVFMRGGNTIKLEHLQLMLYQKRNTLLVEYFVLHDTVLIFVIGADTFEIKNSPVSKVHLKTLVSEFLDLSKNPCSDMAPIFKSLSDILILPIIDFLKNIDLIYFVPHDMLHSIPLHSLYFNGNPLIKFFPVTYTPSSSLIPFFKNLGSKSLETCNIFAVDFLAEGKIVSNQFDNKKLFQMATIDEVKNNLYADILHFSTHGIYDEVDPLNSGIRLDDGILTAKNIFNFKLNSELVTISACESGVNERTKGDDLIGLTRAILYAGASSVLVSLWEVDANATSKFMKDFYRNLKNSDMNFSKALQKTQVDMMKKPNSHPFFWAPFVLVGDSEV